MDRNEIKRLLLLYRPGDSERIDANIEIALSEARRDPELSEWFEQHCAFQRAVVGGLAKIEPPAGLRDRILSRGRPGKKIIRFPGRAILAIAASLALLIGSSLLLTGRSQAQFQAYRDRMVRTALRDYRMTMVSRNQNEIRAFIQKATPHGDYLLTPPLRRLAGEGCVLLSWQGHPVSLICLDAGDQHEVLLFVINRKDISSPPPASPEFRQENKMATFSWSQDDKVYLLAGKGDRASLQKYL